MLLELILFGTASYKLLKAIIDLIKMEETPRLLKENFEVISEGTKLIGEHVGKIKEIKVKSKKINIKFESGELEDKIDVLSKETLENSNQIKVLMKAFRMTNAIKDDEYFEPDFKLDWWLTYLDSIKDITDDELQTYWAHLLVNKSKKRRYSLRTLNTLKNLTKEELELFIRLKRHSFDHGDIRAIANFADNITIYGITDQEMLLMEEIGLINLRGDIHITLEKDQMDHYINNENVIEVKKVNSINDMITIYPFTTVGYELATLDKERDYNFTKENLQSIFKIKNGYKINILNK